MGGVTCWGRVVSQRRSSTIRREEKEPAARTQNTPFCLADSAERPLFCPLPEAHFRLPSCTLQWHAHNCCLQPSQRPFYAHIGIGVPEPTDACYFWVLPMDKRSTSTRDRRRPTRRLGVIGGIRPGFTLTPQTSRATPGTQRALPIANIRMRSEIVCMQLHGTYVRDLQHLLNIQPHTARALQGGLPRRAGVAFARLPATVPPRRLVVLDENVEHAFHDRRRSEDGHREPQQVLLWSDKQDVSTRAKALTQRLSGQWRPEA